VSSPEDAVEGVSSSEEVPPSYVGQVICAQF
jgi:hypothetical protein